MRDFPTQVGPGGEPVSDAASWTSSNANDSLKEAQNTITDTGQVLISIAAPANNTQLSEAISRNVAVATFYADSGAADAYVLSALGSFKAPSAYLDGQIIRWIADNANTGASTVNATGVGVKSLTLEDGTALGAGTIDTIAENQARYSLSDDRFELTRSSGLVSSAATQSQQEAATDNAVFATPANQQYHPSAAKVWVSGTYSTGTPIADASYNVTSLDDDGVGLIGVNFTTAMSSSDFAAVAQGVSNTTSDDGSGIRLKATGSVDIKIRRGGSQVDDPFSAICFGDQ